MEEITIYKHRKPVITGIIANLRYPAKKKNAG